MSRNLPNAQYRNVQVFSKLMLVFKDRFTGKTIGKRSLTADSFRMLTGYSHNTYNLWGILPNGKRRKIPRGVGAFSADNNNIKWHTNPI